MSEGVVADANCFIRIERQTLRKLPATGFILFTIKVLLDPLAALGRHPEGPALARGLKARLQQLDAAQLAYKGLVESPRHSGRRPCPLRGVFRMSRRDESSLAGQLSRYARVGAGMGTAVARVAAGRLMSSERDFEAEAKLLGDALGSLKGPLMKVAQLMATIPDLLPAEYAEELAKLQSHAPPMGWPFVRRRMTAELGPGWETRFLSFERVAAAAASLGQVHRAVSLAGEPLAVKLQYPDMQSAVEADLRQLQLLFSLHRRMDPAIDTTRDSRGDRRPAARGARL